MGQPKILAPLIQVLLRNETIKFCVDIQKSSAQDMAQPMIFDLKCNCRYIHMIYLYAT